MDLLHELKMDQPNHIRRGFLSVAFSAILLCSIACRDPYSYSLDKSVSSNATLVVQVVDKDGMPLDQAEVLITPEHVNVGGVRRVLTDKTGNARFLLLLPDHYTLAVSRPGMIRFHAKLNIVPKEFRLIGVPMNPENPVDIFNLRQ